MFRLPLADRGWKIIDTRRYYSIHLHRCRHKNPLRRVIPVDLISEEHDYDKEKYREMLLEAAESILGYFGFDRTIYGDRKKNRKWWYEIRHKRRKDIETERNVHDG